MSKVSNFYNSLQGILAKTDTLGAKLTIGDSINNNRALTVSQVIRFFEESSFSGSKKLSYNLASVFEEVRPMILNTRTTRRTDAVDINEFVEFYRIEVLNGNKFAKSVISSQLSL